jgi:aspartate aminotransferase
VTFVQYGGVAALDSDQGCVAEMLAEFDKRRRYIVDRLNSLSEVTCATPLGAFYVFPNVGSHYGKTYGGVEVKDSFDFCDALLKQQTVAIVPGKPFDADAHVRLSYATSMDVIEQALDRIESFLASAE